MRYRKISPSGDFVFGSGQRDYENNTPEAVALAVQSSLLLWLGEWYLDLNDGTPYLEGVIGNHSKETADATMVARANQVQGVRSVQNYTSDIDPVTRTYNSISATLFTIYGETQLQIENIGNF